MIALMEQLARALERDTRLAYALLFGSRARGSTVLAAKLAAVRDAATC